MRKAVLRILICVFTLVALLGVSIVILNYVNVKANTAYMRGDNVDFADVYGKYLSRAQQNKDLRIESKYRDDLMDINLHRNSEDDLYDMLDVYLVDNDKLLDGTTIYDLRIELPKIDEYADKLELPHIPGVYTIDNIKLMWHIRQDNYSVEYTSTCIKEARIIIESDGSYESRLPMVDTNKTILDKTGKLDDKQIEEALIEAVKLGFFELPKVIKLYNSPDFETELYDIKIGDHVYTFYGRNRECIDDVYYKVDGLLQKIIRPEVDLYYTCPSY